MSLCHKFISLALIEHRSHGPSFNNILVILNMASYKPANNKKYYCQ